METLITALQWAASFAAYAAAVLILARVMGTNQDNEP